MSDADNAIQELEELAKTIDEMQNRGRFDEAVTDDPIARKEQRRQRGRLLASLTADIGEILLKCLDEGLIEDQFLSSEMAELYRRNHPRNVVAGILVRETFWPHGDFGNWEKSWLHQHDPRGYALTHLKLQHDYQHPKLLNLAAKAFAAMVSTNSVRKTEESEAVYSNIMSLKNIAATIGRKWATVRIGPVRSAIKDLGGELITESRGKHKVRLDNMSESDRERFTNRKI